MFEKIEQKMRVQQDESAQEQLVGAIIEHLQPYKFAEFEDYIEHMLRRATIIAPADRRLDYLGSLVLEYLEGGLNILVAEIACALTNFIEEELSAPPNKN